MPPHDLMSKIKVGVVAGGDKTDPATDHSSNQKILNPLEHGENVDLEHLGFWPMAMNPSQSSQQQFPGALDPGSLIYYLKNTGENGGIILGLANAIRGGGGQSGASGGQSLMTGKVEELINRDIGVSIPPQVEESTERGVKVRKIKEKGQKHNLGLLDGLPNHGALFDMSGFRTPEVKKVPTAKQHNDQMMTQEVFGQLQGIVSSLQGLMQGLKSNGAGGAQNATANAGGGLGNGVSYWDDIHSTLNPNMSKALNSLSTLIQGHETDNGVGYVTGGVVHYGIYLENAVQLLSQVQTMDDLMNVMNRLQWDTSIMGHEALDNVVIQIENAWGAALQEADHNGTITVTYADANAQANFASSMANSTYASAASSSPAPPPFFGGGGSGGGGGGANAGQIAGQVQSLMGQIFGKSAETMQDMWKRLAPSGEQTAKQLHEKLTQQQEAQKQKQVNDATTKNQGDPFSVYTQ